jgi:hypothetical protein
VASANTPLNLHTVLSLVTFFARAKKVTRSPQASESFFKKAVIKGERLDSSFHWNDKRRAKSLDSGFRRNDKRNSRIPAFAGMTSGKAEFRLSLE